MPCHFGQDKYFGVCIHYIIPPDYLIQNRATFNVLIDWYRIRSSFKYFFLHILAKEETTGLDSQKANEVHKAVSTLLEHKIGGLYVGHRLLYKN